jgi:Fe-S-cluster containining protein
MHDFDFLLWQLYHENIKLLKDTAGWYLVIYNACLHLDGSRKCTIYENRPMVCRDHSDVLCEFDISVSESSMLFFDNHESLDEFCKKRFKTWKERYRKPRAR